jgi:SAM-dependent methyltransferase
MKILDATCGTKAMWYEKNHPLVTYMDIREGKYLWWNPKKAYKKNVIVEPDVIGDFTNLDYLDNTFDMVIFDPPHILRTDIHDKNYNMGNRYGFLPRDNWKQILKKGIKELFRVLKPEGIFIFKWADTDKPVEEVLKLFPYKPIFGNKNRFNNRRKKNTYWIVYLKYDVNRRLDIN